MMAQRPISIRQPSLPADYATGPYPAVPSVANAKAQRSLPGRQPSLPTDFNLGQYSPASSIVTDVTIPTPTNAHDRARMIEEAMIRREKMELTMKNRVAAAQTENEALVAKRAAQSDRNFERAKAIQRNKKTIEDLEETIERLETAKRQMVADAKRKQYEVALQRQMEQDALEQRAKSERELECKRVKEETQHYWREQVRLLMEENDGVMCGDVSIQINNIWRRKKYCLHSASLVLESMDATVSPMTFSLYPDLKDVTDGTTELDTEMLLPTWGFVMKFGNDNVALYCDTKEEMEELVAGLRLAAKL